MPNILHFQNPCHQNEWKPDRFDQTDLTIFSDILAKIVEDCKTQDESAIKTKLLLLPGNLHFHTDTENIVLFVSKLQPSVLPLFVIQHAIFSYVLGAFWLLYSSRLIAPASNSSWSRWMWVINCPLSWRAQNRSGLTPHSLNFVLGHWSCWLI